MEEANKEEAIAATCTPTPTHAATLSPSCSAQVESHSFPPRASISIEAPDADTEAEEHALRAWFPATRPDYEARCGDVKQLVKEDLKDPHRRRHLESFRQSMLEWETYDPSVKNEVQEETADAFLAELLRVRPKTNKEFNLATKALRKKYRVAPAKSQLVAAYNRLLAAEPTSDEPAERTSASPIEQRNNNTVGNGVRNTMLESLMRRKAVRTNSGVLVITVLTAPGRFSCPQDCHYCPNEPGQPRSYLSTEPAVLRANQNGWSPLRQFQDRAGTLKRNGHVVDKIEVLVLGGTWSGYPQDYQEEFIRDIYYAANVFSSPEPVRDPESESAKNGESVRKRALWTARLSLSLEEEQNLNETAWCRIVGLTLETRPDFITRYELRRLRRFGCTRVQLGVQHVDDEVLQNINRGCTRYDAIKAIRMLKDAGFKVDVHLMPDLPTSSPDADREMFFYILASQDLQADQWKIYPCEVTPFSTIEQWYKEGKYIPYADADGEELLSLICSVKAAVHPWVRLNRVVRDIPNQSIIGGNNVTNLRLAELCVRRYETNGGVEFFLSFETPDRKTIFGFLRLRLRGQRNSRDCPFTVLKGAALLRELHVYGCLVPHGEAKGSDDSRPQHAGFGRRLIQAAEIIALANGYFRMAVIAGIGTRMYYRTSGYHLEDSYMVKNLTISGLHAGRAEPLADLPAKLKIEYQDMQQAASALLLPLPPRAPQRRRKEVQGNKRKGKGRNEGAEDGVADAAAAHETKVKAELFRQEYIERIEELDVLSLLRRLEDSEVPQSDAEPASVFVDTDTFSEWRSRYASLQRNQECSRSRNYLFAHLPRCAYSWLYGYFENIVAKCDLSATTLAATAAAASAATVVLWLLTRRKHSA